MSRSILPAVNDGSLRAYSPARLKVLAEREARRHHAKYVSHSVMVTRQGAALCVSWMLKDFSFRQSEVLL